MDDVIIVGGGHNGLVCAAYLARAGWRVTVLESRPVLGGLCTTEETVAEAPGFKMNPASIDQIFTSMPNSVVDELDLPVYGLEWIVPNPAYSYVHPSGSAIRFWHEVELTADDFRVFSKRDAERYVELVGIMKAVWDVGLPYLQGHPRRIRVGDIARMGARAFATRQNLPRGLRMMLQSPGAVIEEWFESEEVRAALGSFAVSSMAPLDEPGSGLILSAMALIHGFRVRRPVGGNGAFTDALVRCATDHGAEVVAGARVEEILLSGGRADGVRLASGEVRRADAVVAALDPWTLAHRLLPPGAFSEQVYAELRGMSVHRNNVSVFKADVALDRKPVLDIGEYGDSLLNTCMMFSSGLGAVRRATVASSYGELCDEPPFWVMVPSHLDRTLVPDGSVGDSLYVYVPSAPLELRHSSWDREKDAYLDRCLDIFETYAPGTKASVIGSNVISPDDIGRYSDVYRGHLFHVDMELSQLGPWRPTPSLSGYRTPVPGLWHTGAGAHPVGAVSGWSGRSTARLLLRGGTGRGRRPHVGRWASTNGVPVLGRGRRQVGSPPRASIHTAVGRPSPATGGSSTEGTNA